MEVLPAFEIVGGAITLGVVAAILKTEVVDRKFGGLIALAVGVALGVGYAATLGEAPFVGVIHGLVAGLVASGLWSTGKNGVVEPMAEARDS